MAEPAAPLIELEALRKVYNEGLPTAEEVLHLDRERLAHSWAVLRDYGNMSSATVLFMLKRAMVCGDHGPHLMAAFGPGFSAYFLAVDL